MCINMTWHCVCQTLAQVRKPSVKLFVDYYYWTVTNIEDKLPVKHIYSENHLLLVATSMANVKTHPPNCYKIDSDQMSCILGK